MTIDEAIKYHLKEAERNEKEAKYKSMYANRSASECLQCTAEHRQLAEWLTELKEARKLLTPTKYKIKHEEYDMHGEHYRDCYVLCPNCDKVFGNLYYDDGASDEFINRANEVYIKKFEDVKFCPNCGQKIDWNIDSKKIKEEK